MAVKKDAAEIKGVKFEEALKRLEKIVEKLEGGETALEESLELYEEGISLFRQCSSKLEEAKKKVEILTKGGGGKMKAEAFPSGNSAGSDEDDKLPF